MHPLTFDDYTVSAPEMSERWATSDRGWLYDALGDCVGFYLQYEAIRHIREAPYVLACVYEWTHPGTGYGDTINRRHRDCQTVAEAKAWMLAEHGATEATTEAAPGEAA